MGGEKLARGVRPEPVHQIEHTGRQVDLVADLGEQRRRGGSLLRWLDDDRIAGSERRRHLPTHQQEWQVPRSDHGYDAERLVHRVVERAPAVRRVCPVTLFMEPDRQVGKHPEIRYAARDIQRTGQRLRLAGVGDFGAHEFFEPPLHTIGNPPQPEGTLLRGELAPTRLHSGAGSRHGLVHEITVSLHDLRVNGPIDRIHIVEAAARGDEAAGDVVADQLGRAGGAPWCIFHDYR